MVPSPSSSDSRSHTLSLSSAHVKSSMMGASLIVPVSQGRLLLGIWQGIYLNEHRNYGGPRRIAITINGMRM